MSQPTWVLGTGLASSTRVVPGLKHRAPSPFPKIIYQKQQLKQSDEGTWYQPTDHFRLTDVIKGCLHLHLPIN